MNNGGFQQYFCNSSAETAHSLVGALIEIRAPKTAKICGKAIQLIFPKGMPKRFEDISAAASQMEEKTVLALGKLDTEFCKYPHDLTELLYDFVISHPEEFAAPQRSSWFSSILQKFKSLLSI